MGYWEIFDKAGKILFKEIETDNIFIEDNIIKFYKKDFKNNINDLFLVLHKDSFGGCVWRDK